MLLSQPLKPVLFLTLIVTAALCATSASALLIDNGTTTTDTDTNLEWLDLTETLGLS